jgi:branched-chain amino acid transport system ATP-binding protein
MLLEVEHLTMRFGGLIAVNDVSFQVDRGQILGLVGPNGAGKSTLFNSIAGFCRPQSGTVRLEDRSIGGRSPHDVARCGLARTFQMARPFGELSVLENVLVGAYMHARSRRQATASAIEALERASFMHRAHAPAQDLTATERKRLDLARCLATSPKVLLVDEVIAGCSDEEMDQILATLRNLKADGVAIVMVEHVLRAVMAVCDRILVLANGAVIVEGTAQEVRSDPRAIEVYLGADVAADAAPLTPRRPQGAAGGTEQ